jgi:nucleoside-diphosphate-sugar epimerase
MSKNVLVTGLSGLIGSALRPVLEDEFNLSALNRSEVPGIPTTQASLENYDDILPAFQEQDTVIHLAAKISDSAGWQALLETNVIGTRHVFEAAKEAGVKRVVFASSGATVSGWEQDEPYRSVIEGRYEEAGTEISMIDESMATRPGNLYASTKIWGESLARFYAGTFGLEVVCLRIGFANEQDRPTNSRQFSVWNSQRDVVQAIRLAMEVELPDGFDVFFILSNNQWAYRSLDHAKTGLGYEPVDSAESYR